MACETSHSAPVNYNGPGSAASSTVESIVKTSAPGSTRCIDCGEFSCCCIPIPCTIM